MKIKYHMNDIKEIDLFMNVDVVQVFFFNKTNEFNQHIKTSTHLHFIQNYENYYKEVDEALDTIKDLRIEIDKLKKKKTKLKNKNKELNKTIESMKK